jgi:multiple sugar transport system ATP-binding protein
MGSLSLQRITKRFGSFNALESLDLEVADGEFLTLLGPSGCGKSTLLNIIAGLDRPSSGQILIDRQDVSNVLARDRDIAMIFQSYALYPNMTVRQNIMFGLKMRGVPRREREEAAKRVAEMLKVTHLLERKPYQLSGGQRQRVAMGRALVRNPKVFLFDEPLSNLDAQLRAEMRIEIKRLHQKVGTTVVYVTHDQVEAMTMSSRIVVMSGGKIVQIGTPSEIYNRPAHVFVARFVGSPAMNFLPGELTIVPGGLAVKLARKAASDPEIIIPVPGTAPDRAFAGRKVTVGVRPEAITLGEANARSVGKVAVQRKIDVLEPTGADTLALFELAGVEAVARLSPSEQIAVGDTASFVLDAASFHFFDASSEQRLEIAASAAGTGNGEISLKN